jgi:hypothetical protein
LTLLLLCAALVRASQCSLSVPRGPQAPAPPRIVLRPRPSNRTTPLPSHRRLSDPSPALNASHCAPRPTDVPKPHQYQPLPAAHPCLPAGHHKGQHPLKSAAFPRRRSTPKPTSQALNSSARPFNRSARSAGALRKRRPPPPSKLHELPSIRHRLWMRSRRPMAPVLGAELRRLLACRRSANWPIA